MTKRPAQYELSVVSTEGLKGCSDGAGGGHACLTQVVPYSLNPEEDGPVPPALPTWNLTWKVPPNQALILGQPAMPAAMPSNCNRSAPKWCCGEIHLLKVQWHCWGREGWKGWGAAAAAADVQGTCRSKERAVFPCSTPKIDTGTFPRCLQFNLRNSNCQRLTLFPP